MSIQVQTAGRRTPLSLSGTQPQSGKNNKQKQAENIPVEKPENKTEKTIDKKEEKKSTKAPEAVAKENTTAKAEVTKPVEVKEVETKKKEKEAPKEKSQNGTEPEKEAKSSTNGAKKDEEKQNGEKSATPSKRESARQKEILKEETEVVVAEVKEEKKSKKDKPENKKKESETTPKKVAKPISEPEVAKPIREPEPLNQTFDDVEMEPLLFEQEIVAVPPTAITPGKTQSAKSTPTKASTSFEYERGDAIAFSATPDRGSCPPTYRAISGRRSFRPTKEYNFQSSSVARESYRKINTELDVTNNTSMNVTVGSEAAPEDVSYSWFGRSSRKRQLPQWEEGSVVVEGQSDEVAASPKRPRTGFGGFFDILSSPMTLLRGSLARSTIQSSTPRKLSVPSADEHDVDVVNVSGISVEEVDQDLQEDELPVDISIVSEAQEEEVEEFEIPTEGETIKEDKDNNIPDPEKTPTDQKPANKRCTIM